MDAAPARDADEAGGSLTTERTATEGSRPRRRALVALAVVLGLVLIAAVVVVIIRARQVEAHNALQDDRGAALQAAEQFALRMDAFDGANLTAYTKSVEPLLTDKEKTVFTQQLQQFAQLYDQVQKASQGAKGKQDAKKPQPGTGSIVMAGVSDIDTDSATVLVAHDSTIPGTAQKLHSRWTISMRKIDGKWLVDSFTPVA